MDKFNSLRIMFRDYEELVKGVRTVTDEALRKELHNRVYHQQQEIKRVLEAIELNG